MYFLELSLHVTMPLSKNQQKHVGTLID